MKEMQEVDIRTVDRSQLVDIKDVTVDQSLPERERLADYIRQIKNPYCYISNGVVVKVTFSGKTTLEECLARYCKAKLS
ncbi:MAG: hypothetical protein EOM40_14665 [Clostridia bacterium]|nr:hypothetical protein [Clostridia bacterium]